ncbi:MAG: hypothetical protein Q4Q06_06955, partial [Bacteroidota bacterium]|nr:hypothetical protein [Bacteroidota bacterium]
IREITDRTQNIEIQKYIKNNLLFVKSFDSIELNDVLNFHRQQTNNMTITDCSVCVYAKKNKYRLLTGDKNTRHIAQSNNIQVNGVLFLFTGLVDSAILTKQQAIQKLKALQHKNARLPKSEIEKLITLWQV